jgi:hypothetical protein
MTTDAPRIPSGFVAPPTPEQLAEAVPVQHDRPDDAPERDAEAVEATPAAAAPSPEVSAGPDPLAAGTYAVYDDQQGGYVLVIGTREGETHHKHIPARVVKMAEMAMGGNSPLAAMFGAA